MGSLNDPFMDDLKDFQETDAAMTHMGMSDNEKTAIYTIVATVLHLGNISFEENTEDKKGRNLMRWRNENKCNP